MVTMVSVPGRSAAYVTYFVWLGIFSFYFLRARWALAQTAWMAVLYAARSSPTTSRARWSSGSTASRRRSGSACWCWHCGCGSRCSSARLEQTARTDQLTGLPNRRAFDERLGDELARLDRSEEVVSLLILDLDHFKALNDTSGHISGDRALKSGRRRDPQPESATVDWPARIGGDEFAVVLPGADESEAMQVAERIRAGIEQAFAGQEVPLAVSVGGAASRGLPDRRRRAAQRGRPGPLRHEAPGRRRRELPGPGRRPEAATIGPVNEAGRSRSVPADKAILDLECESIAGHTCKIVVLGEGAPGVEELRSGSPTGST